MIGDGGLAEVAGLMSRLEAVHWLAVATAVAFLVLVGVLLFQTRTQRRRQRELAKLAGGKAPDYVESDPRAALEGVSLSPIDNVFPRQPGRFLLLVAFISIGAWLAGYALARDTGAFFASREWISQPFYIAVHLITLRMFINVFTRNYAAGVSRVKISRAEALRGIRPVLGPLGALVAAVIAVPLCWFDLQYMLSDRYAPLAEGRAASDYLMWGIWSVEWFINAFIWVLLVAFMFKNCSTLSQYPFRDGIDVVLAEKLYRPFLQMSAQGSTVVLGFSVVTVGYIIYTEGALTDYLGLGITVALLVVCFVPPWVVLRSKVKQAFTDELRALRQGAGVTGASGGLALTSGGGGAVRSVEQRLDEMVALLKVWHLQNLYGSLGNSEATAIMVRLLPAVATIGWQVIQRQEALVEWLGRMLRASGSA